MKLLFLNSKFVKSLTLAVFATLMILAVWGPGVSAHTLYIQSTRYHASSGQSLPLFFCYGHYVPVADGIRGKKLNTVNVIAPDHSTNPIQVRNETGLHSYMVEYGTPGIWTLTAQTTPGYYTIYTDKKGKEHHAVKSMAQIKDRAETIHKSYYVKQYAKTYVNCGKFSGPMPPAAGLGLELMPVTNLFTLTPGENLELEILLDGRPFKGKGNWDATYLGFSTLAEDNYYPKTVVEGSRLSIPIPKSGRWFVRYSINTDAPKEDLDKYLEMKLSASLTFQIDNERKTPKETDH